MFAVCLHSVSQWAFQRDSKTNTSPPTLVALHGCMHKGHRNTLELAHAGSLWSNFSLRQRNIYANKLTPHAKQACLSKLQLIDCHRGPGRGLGKQAVNIHERVVSLWGRLWDTNVCVRLTTSCVWWRSSLSYTTLRFSFKLILWEGWFVEISLLHFTCKRSLRAVDRQLTVHVPQSLKRSLLCFHL